MTHSRRVQYQIDILNNKETKAGNTHATMFLEGYCLGYNEGLESVANHLHLYKDYEGDWSVGNVIPYYKPVF